MNINLIVIKGRLSLTEGGIVDFYRFCWEFLQKHGIVNRGGRVDFYCLGNVVSVTSDGYLIVFLAVNIALALGQIEEILRTIGEAFVHFASIFSEFKYQAVKLHFSGKFSLDKTTLIKRLKKFLQNQTLEVASIWLWSKYHKV